MRDPEEGVDYLIDWYSLLGASRDATREELKAIFREKIKQYHPDRLEGMAPELVARAKHESALLNRANETVIENQAVRAAYDERLANWTKPISKHGEMIIDLMGGGFSFSKLLEGTESDPQAIEKDAERLALQFSSFNQATYDLICEQMESQTEPSAKLKKAYQEQIAQRDLYLQLKEGFLWEAIGVGGAERESSIYYIDQVDEEIDVVKSQAEDRIQSEVLLLTSGQRTLLVAPQGQEAQADSSQVLAHYQAKVGEHIEQHANKLREIAEERQKLLNARFEQANIVYHPLNVEFTPKLIVEFKREGVVIARFPFLIDGDRVTEDPALEHEELSEPGRIEELIRQGYSVVSFTPVSDIELKSQLNRVVDIHAATMLEQLQQSD